MKNQKRSRVLKSTISPLRWALTGYSRDAETKPRKSRPQLWNPIKAWISRRLLRSQMKTTRLQARTNSVLRWNNLTLPSNQQVPIPRKQAPIQTRDQEWIILFSQSPYFKANPERECARRIRVSSLSCPSNPVSRDRRTTLLKEACPTSRMSTRPQISARALHPKADTA